MCKVLIDSSYDSSKPHTLQDQHGHLTRRRGDFFLISRCRKEKKNNPNHIKELTTLSSFKKTYRNFL